MSNVLESSCVAGGCSSEVQLSILRSDTLGGSQLIRRTKNNGNYKADGKVEAMSFVYSGTLAS